MMPAALNVDDPIDNQPAIVLENTETKQAMMFRVSPGEVTPYRDFDPPSDYHPSTVVYTRVREDKKDAWKMWVGETVEP
jgi:hypothetical protein